MKNELFNSIEMAQYLNCSIHTVRNWTRKNKIPHFEKGGRLFFDKSIIEYWLQTVKK